MSLDLPRGLSHDLPRDPSRRQQSGADFPDRHHQTSGNGSHPENISPSKLFILHGDEEDGDDILALLLLRGLEQMQMVKLQGIAFSDASDDSWRAAAEVPSVESKRATLDLLDMGQAAVVKLLRSEQPMAVTAASGPEEPPGDAHGPTFAGGRDSSDRLRAAAGGDGACGGGAASGEIIRTVFENADDNTLQLVSPRSLYAYHSIRCQFYYLYPQVIASSIIHFAILLRDDEDLVVAKISEVTILCDVMDVPFARGSLMADVSSCRTDEEKEAAAFVLSRCQHIGISLVVVTRSAAAATSMPAFIFDELASTGHPVALRLRATTIKSISALWARVNQPMGSAARRRLGDTCDREWFSTSFCGGRDLSKVEAVLYYTKLS